MGSQFFIEESDLDEGFIFGWEADDYTEDDMDSDTRDQREADLMGEKADRADA